MEDEKNAKNIQQSKYKDIENTKSSESNQQNSTSELTESTTKTKVSKSNKIRLLTLAIITAILLAGLAIYSVFQYLLPNEPDSSEKTEMQAETNVSSPKVSPSTAFETQLNLTPTDKSTPSKEPEKIFIREWKKYSSERFGLEFSNPGNFFLQTTYEDFYEDQGHIHVYPMKYWELITDPNPQGRGGPPLIEISGFENKENLTLLEFAKKRSPSFAENEKYIITMLDGQSAIRYSWEGMGKGATVLAYKPNSNLIIGISVFLSEETSEGFEEILKSFEFTE